MRWRFHINRFEPSQYIGLGIYCGQNWKGEKWVAIDLIFVEIGWQQYPDYE